MGGSFQENGPGPKGKKPGGGIVLSLPGYPGRFERVKSLEIAAEMIEQTVSPALGLCLLHDCRQPT